jgi:Tfp pilus assembly protein PilO
MAKELRGVLIFAGVFLVLALFAAYFVHNTMQEVDQIEAEIATMEQDIERLENEAKKHDALVEELENLKANFAQYVKILPAAEVATEERLMDLIQEKCERSQFGVGTYRVKPQKKAGKRKTRGGGFQEIDVSLSAKGTFEQFLRFLNSLERHESFLRVNTFTCTSAGRAVQDAEGNETWPLAISLNISTFRYEAGGK